MKKLLNKIKYSEFGSFFCDLSFVLPLGIVTLLSYLFQLVTFTIGQDDLTRSRYTAGQLFSQGRFSSYFICKFFGFDEIRPFWEPLTAIIFIFFAGVCLAMIFRRILKDKLAMCWYTVFACLFVTFPLINEFFIFKGLNRNSAIGYFLIFLAVLLMQNAFRKHRILNLSAATFILIFITSLYESLVLVYVGVVCLLLFAEAVTASEKIKHAFNKVFLFAIPAVLGVILEFIIGKILDKIFVFAEISAAGNSIVFSKDISIVNVLYELFRRYVFAGLWYFPICLFVIACVAFAAFSIYFAIKKKSFFIIIASAGAYASLFILGFLTAGAMKYRMCQFFAVFTAFVFTLCFIWLAEISHKKYFAVLLAAMLIFLQAAMMTKYFYNDYMRWREEKEVLINVCEELKGYDLSKPCVFVGAYELSEKVMNRRYVRADDERYVVFKKLTHLNLTTTDFDDTYVLEKCQATFSGVITWGIDAFDECNTELYNVIRYLGYHDFKQGTKSQLDYYSNLTNDSDKPYLISEYDDAIVVCF